MRFFSLSTSALLASAAAAQQTFEICATKLGPNPVASVKTVSYAITVDRVVTHKLTVTPTSTITPPAVTTTTTAIATSISTVFTTPTSTFTEIDTTTDTVRLNPPPLDN